MNYISVVEHMVCKQKVVVGGITSKKVLKRKVPANTIFAEILLEYYCQLSVSDTDLGFHISNCLLIIG